MHSNNNKSSSSSSSSRGIDFSTPHTAHHRITGVGASTKTMGLNIPMLIASSQTLDSWNTAGQYSPPIGNTGGGPGGIMPNSQQQQQLRVPMSYGGGGGGGGGTPYTGGGSSSSEFQPSPHKTIDTSDNEDNNHRDEATAAALGQLAAKVERRSPHSSHAAVDGGGGGGGMSSEPGGGGGDRATPIAVALSEAGSSPIPNTNTHEAHKNHLLQSSPASASGRAATPRQAHEQLPHGHSHSHGHGHSHTHSHSHSHHGHHADELDIKQELVDYFHPSSAVAPPPPPPPLDSHRSYSSAGEESRLQLDMAQDLRVAQAKAQANYAGFVLPPRSSSAQLAAAAAAASMPLNMRKLTAASSAGHLLMNSLLSSRESMSDADGDNDNDGEATESAASPGRIKSSVSAQDATSAAAAAAAFYADSLSRDDCDFVGSNVSMKLRTMDRTQRIIAEKLISEVLYFGQFNELERTARIQPK
ncbi:hypothetical protein ACLKA7_002710 [Drosophila subpalustris]